MSGRTDEPFIPSIREVYWINTLLMGPSDQKPRRPIVVVEVPMRPNGMIAVVARTSNMKAPGVAHVALPDIGLNKPGVFSRYARVDAGLWTPHAVGQPVGMLPADVFELIVDRFLT